MSESIEELLGNQDLDSTALWSVQSDRSLMSAGSILANAPIPADVNDSLDLFYGWLALAEAWTQRALAEARISHGGAKRHK